MHVCASLHVAMLAALATLPATMLHASGDRALGQYLSAECVTCHQVSGKYDGIPPIIGWPEESFIQIMNEYRKRDRQNPVMQTIAGRLSHDEIAALATYFGSLKAAPTGPAKRKGGKS
jgi:cytochrome c553